MKNVTIYTGPLCNFCDAAKRLLARNNIEYKEISIATVDGAMDEMIKKTRALKNFFWIYFNFVGNLLRIILKDLVIYFLFLKL